MSYIHPQRPRRRMAAPAGVLFLVLLSSVACSPSAATGKPATDVTKLELEAPTTVITKERATDVESLLAEAQVDLVEGRFEQASEGFELVVKVAQKAHVRRRGLLGWGTSLDAMGKPESALAVYDRYVKEAPEGRERDGVLVRQVRLLTYLEDYRRAAALAAQVKTEQVPLAEIALLASRALDSIVRNQPIQAERWISRARTVVEEQGYDRLTKIPRDVAAVYFALGELRRLRGEEVVFSPLPENFGLALESRCQWILDAQAAYSQAMRAEDAHWSAMAGVSVGQLYHALHKELMSVPFPQAAVSEEERELFEGAMRLRYAILLRKAASMLEATLALRKKDRQQSSWVQRAERALTEIQEARSTEDAALEALPYSRQQLQQGLDELQRRGSLKD